LSIALDLEPYEWSQDLGPDDLSDVDLNHPNFRKHFPDGKVPIRHVPMPRAGLGDGFDAWATNVLTTFEHAQLLDVDLLAHTRDQLLMHEPRSGDAAVADIKAARMEQKVYVARLIEGGMTLRQIARYLGWTDRRLVEAVTSAEFMRDGRDRVESVLLCDEALASPDMRNVRWLARRHDIDQSVVRGLLRLRLGQSWDKRSDDAWDAACTRVDSVA
jgi:hypothetical protein